MKNLVFIADAHLEDKGREVSAFRNFLQSLIATTHTLAILGDLFDLWIAKKRLEQEYHSMIVDQLRVLRMSGVRLIYVEGNRDFHIKHCYQGDPFDVVSNDGHVEEFDSRRFYLHHGDMVNVDDRMYLLWRRFSKSRAIWKIFNSLPLNAEAVIAKNLEKRLRGSNIKYKSCFPHEKCSKFARRILEKDHQIAVIGHLHKEGIFEFAINGEKKFLYSLPAWKDEMKYLLFEPGREGRFVSFSY